MKTIGFEVFIKTLHKRFRGVYSEDQLKKVIACYTASNFGIKGQITSKEEFRDRFFGSFRFTDKGYENFCKEFQSILTARLNITRLIHESKRRKAAHEKRNKNAWLLMNSVEGFKFKNNTEIEKRRKISAVRSRQMKYINKVQRDELHKQRKIRKIRNYD